jgi:chorismate mutase-like protein
MEKLREFRSRLNTLDANLIELLCERYDICREVAQYKKVKSIPMMQSARVNEVKERCAQLGIKRRLDPGFVKRLYTLIIDESCRIEDEIIDAPEEQVMDA